MVRDLGLSLCNVAVSFYFHRTSRIWTTPPFAEMRFKTHYNLAPQRILVALQRNNEFTRTVFWDTRKLSD
jgi:hypothetical protein